MNYDVLIIGGGVCGCAVACELARFDLRIAVLEKGEDVCCGASKANSGIVHAGFDAENGSLKAKLNLEGTQIMESLCADLDVPYRRNGSLVLCLKTEDWPNLENLYRRGLANGVENLQILNAAEVKSIEPNVADECIGALYAPSAGIVCPFTLTIALAENAALNGVDFLFNQEVQQVRRADNMWEVETSQARFNATVVVNCAGIYADVFHNQVSVDKIEIIPRCGEYFLLDKKVGDFVKATIFSVPGKYGKGVLISPTIHGNLLIGPTAVDIADKEGTNTTAAGLEELLTKGGLTVKNLPERAVITSFAGLRAHNPQGDFIIGEVQDAPYFFDAAGIESPGLTAAPAIGKMLALQIAERLNVMQKTNIIEKRCGIVPIHDLPPEDLNRYVQQNPLYGKVVCRCEMVTEGEIVDAVQRGAVSLDGLKRRLRVGSGRCQGGFCTPRAMEILARESRQDLDALTKCGGESKLICGCIRDNLES